MTIAPLFSAAELYAFNNSHAPFHFDPYLEYNHATGEWEQSQHLISTIEPPAKDEAKYGLLLSDGNYFGDPKPNEILILLQERTHKHYFVTSSDRCPKLTLAEARALQLVHRDAGKTTQIVDLSQSWGLLRTHPEDYGDYSHRQR